MANTLWTERRLVLLALALSATAACGEKTPTGPEVAEVESPAVVEELTIGPVGEQIRVTDALALSVTARYGDGSEAPVDPGDLAWSVSSGADVVDVDGNGTVVGKAVGRATVRGEQPGGASAELEVTVRPFASEGDLDSPAAPELPHRGEVDDGMSVYRFGGLTPGEPYTIEVTAILGEIHVIGFSDRSYSTDRCRASLAVQEGGCPLPAGDAGEIYLVVNGRDASGSIYSVDVVPGGITNEGSRADPVDLSGLLPYAGTVSNADSYYLIRGLSPGEAFTVHLTNPTDDVQLWVASSGDWGGHAYRLCTSDEAGASSEICAYTANSDGELHVRVSGGDTAGGATYTLDLVEGGFFDEGLSFAPLDVTGALPYSGRVATGWSYYLVTGLVTGTAYTVTVHGASDDTSLAVWSGLGTVPQWLECTSMIVGADAGESCAAKAVNGELRIGVGGGATAEGATFTLDVTPGGIPREGNVVVPLDITGALPYGGSANPEGSYYLVTGLTPGTTATVTVGQLTDAVGLRVSDPATGVPSCYSENSGTSDESCTATVGASGEVVINVDTRSGAVGAYYVVDVSVP